MDMVYNEIAAFYIRPGAKRRICLDQAGLTTAYPGFDCGGGGAYAADYSGTGFPRVDFPGRRAAVPHGAGFVYDATIGIMSLGLLCGISYSYAETFAEADRTFCLVAVMAALGSFFVLFCVRADGGFDFSSLGAVSMFGAILCSIAATALFRAFNRYLPAASGPTARARTRSFRSRFP